MIEIKEINRFSRGFIVHYTITTPSCGCCGPSITRHSLQINQKDKPTTEQATLAIEQHESKNK